MNVTFRPAVALGLLHVAYPPTRPSGRAAADGPDDADSCPGVSAKPSEMPFTRTP
jgi:hypothetical protein